MGKRFKCIHIVIEICLAVICLGIGRFEDKFILPMFVIATVYNFVYVLFLRRKTGEKVLAGIANIIMVWAVLINAIIVTYAMFIFIFGYTDYGLLGMAEGTTYYGLDAWKNNLALIVYGPCAIINFVYIGVYVWVKNKFTLAG